MTVSDKFFQDANNTRAESSDPFHRSYQHFVGYFADREELVERDLVIGCYFSYGWMPTMLELRGDLRATIELTNRVKSQGCRLTNEEIKEVASNVNGSIVGTSKLLHFIRPDVHAIWDTRVYRYLHQKNPYHYRVQKLEAYGGYLEYLAELHQDKRFDALKKRLEKEIGYEVSHNRIGEYVMYQHGAKLTRRVVENHASNGQTLPDCHRTGRE